MSVRMRLARWGARKRPYYHIVVADSKAPRDGKFIETLGKYNPMLGGSLSEKVTMKRDRVEYWLSVGAVTTDRVSRILADHGIIEYTPSFSKKTTKDKSESTAQHKESQPTQEETVQADAAQKEATQEKTVQADAAQKEATQEKTVQADASQGEVTQEKAVQADATQEEATQEETVQADATEPQDVPASDAEKA